MVELIVLNYLKTALTVPVHMEKPEKPPEQFVLIEKTGGSKSNYIKSAAIVLQSYAESLYAAADLNEQVKRAMDNIVVLDSVSRSELNTDYNYTDTTKKEYRYQAVYDLIYFDD